MVNENWRSGRIKDFLELQRGFDITKDEVVEGIIPVYSSSGLAYFHNTHKVEPPGVVIGRKGSLGKVFFIEERFWPHDTTLWVKNFKGNWPKYIKYFLDFIKLEKLDEASSIPTLNRNNVHIQKCRFPPITEQKKIAKILATWDSAIEKLEALIMAKQKRKKALMQLLLTGKKRFEEFKGNTWTKIPLSKLLEPVSRPISKPATSYKALGIRSHGKGTFQRGIDDPNTVAMDTLYQVKQNDLIVNITFAWEGAIALVKDIDEGCLVSHRFPTFVFNETICLPDYLRQLILTKWFVFKLGLISPGGAGRNRVLSKKDFLKLRFQLPAIEEQKVIAEFLQQTDKEIELQQKQLEALKRQKKGLMQQLLTGKKRVTPDPEDYA